MQNVSQYKPQGIYYLCQYTVAVSFDQLHIITSWLTIDNGFQTPFKTLAQRNTYKCLKLYKWKIYQHTIRAKIFFMQTLILCWILFYQLYSSIVKLPLSNQWSKYVLRIWLQLILVQSSCCRCMSNISVRNSSGIKIHSQKYQKLTPEKKLLCSPTKKSDV